MVEWIIQAVQGVVIHRTSDYIRQDTFLAGSLQERAGGSKSQRNKFGVI